jgi:hypothetical protein
MTLTVGVANQKVLALLVASALLLTLAVPDVAQQPTTASAGTLEYVDHALDLMQQHSINARKIDWSTVRKETLARAANAQTTYDTYDAIRFALGSLNDHHSFLQLDEELSRREGESHRRRGVTPSKPTGSEKWPPSPYIDRKSPKGEMMTIDGIRIGRVVVPALENGDQARMEGFADALQKYIEALAKQNPQGWLVDLRGNLGGNMWPMLAGIAPLLDTRVVGSFVDADGKKTSWFVDAKGSGLRNPNGSENVICCTGALKIGFREPQTIAVLIDRGTASSGEAIAIAFQGQPRVRFFGHETHGETTANEGFPLSDGANLVLATAVEADRTGKVYLSGITPDVELREENQRPKSIDSDPMVRAAARWIKLNPNPNADEKE